LKKSNNCFLDQTLHRRSSITVRFEYLGATPSHSLGSTQMRLLHNYQLKYGCYTRPSHICRVTSPSSRSCVRVIWNFFEL